MEKYLRDFTWYYDTDGRVWMVLAVLLNDPLNQTVWMIEAGVHQPKEHPYQKVADLILNEKLKLYTKPKTDKNE